MQSRKNSFIESLSQVLVGYLVAVVGQLLIFPLFDISVSLASNLIIGLWFAIIAVAKSYAIRRWFNKKTEVTKSHVAVENKGLKREDAVNWRAHPKDFFDDEENLPMMLRRQSD